MRQASSGGWIIPWSSSRALEGLTPQGLWVGLIVHCLTKWEGLGTVNTTSLCRRITFVHQDCVFVHQPWNSIPASSGLLFRQQLWLCYSLDYSPQQFPDISNHASSSPRGFLPAGDTCEFFKGKLSIHLSETKLRQHKADIQHTVIAQISYSFRPFVSFSLAKLKRN